MANKIQRSFYLETDVFNYIKTYQEEYALSSISVALERIIFSIMLGNNIQIKSKENAIEKKDKTLPKSIANIRNSMKEILLNPLFY